MLNRNKYRNIKKRKTMRIEKPIIFIGTGRSGTTIISEIVMRHRALAFPFNYQNIFFRNPKINLIRNIFDNKFWKIYGQKKQLNTGNLPGFLMLYNAIHSYTHVVQKLFTWCSWLKHCKTQ